MAELRRGTITRWRQLSPLLALFRLAPEGGRRFPDYVSGQYMALRRDNCRLTQRVMDESGRARYVPDLDEQGRQKRGAITHAYSIASAPFETSREGHLEFYVVLEIADSLGRFTESLFDMEPREGGALSYMERTAGDFTLERRAQDAAHVLLVGTGTGVAPFVSMLKQLDHDAGEGRDVPRRVTLFYANRRPAELAFHDELAAIACARRFDFVYVPAVSRPGSDGGDPAIGRGRATNVLRHALGLPRREEEALEEAKASGADPAPVAAALATSVPPVLPAGIDPGALRARVAAAGTVVLTCGNPAAMEDVARVARRQGMRFEKEDW